ncbi:MAG: endolytic transglycosylase MltG [Candidatus Acidiferrales bacterium]
MGAAGNKSSSRRTNWLVAASAAFLVVLSLLMPYQGYTENVTLVIPQGMGRPAIADELASRGVLYSRWPFLLYAYARPWRTLKAGEYSFDRPLSAAEVFRKLERGEVRLYPLRIPEGLTRWEIADEVARMQLASRAAFLAATEDTALIRHLAPEARTLEGFLFPDTYNFARPSDPRQIVRTMVEHFRRVYESLEQPNAAERSGRRRLKPHELVTLASLIEKETGVPEERGLVAAVFYNRLERGWVLACDPTVIYAKRLANEGQFDGYIRVSDLERKSPYNTYLNAGLPPGPIASPGRASLEAALAPPESNYLFFVSNTRGGHFFAATSAEHSRNVARYRRLRAEQERQAARAPQPRGLDRQ